jgi:hypothetical protein
MAMTARSTRKVYLTLDEDDAQKLTTELDALTENNNGSDKAAEFNQVLKKALQ